MEVEKVMVDVLYGPEVNNEGLKALVQAISRGRMDEHEAQRILEFAPRLADMLMQGLSGMYGEVGPRKFVEMAKAGQINGGAMSRAMT